MTDTPTVALLGTGIMGSAWAATSSPPACRCGSGTGRPTRPGCSPTPVQSSLPTRPTPSAAPMSWSRCSATAATSRATDQAKAEGPPAGQIWAQMTTAGIDQHDLLAFAADHGLVFVDAPVSGTRQPAESGQLL